MSFSDEQLLQFFRRTPGGVITQRDIDLSGDVWSLQPILFYLAYSCKAKTLIEIGVADGSTTMPLIKAAMENDGILYSIDPSRCEDAHRLVDASGYQNYWKFNHMKSDDFFARFNSPVDFAFIDGDHSFVQVAKDVENCCKLLTRGGMVFVSDFNTSIGPPEYIDPEVYTKDTNYETQCQNGIFKGLKLVVDKFKHLHAIYLADRSNPSVLIGYRYDYNDQNK